MAHTFIAPTESGGGAWHREVTNVLDGAEVKTANVPTGGWRSTPVNGGLGAILSGSYAQQAGIGAILSNQYPQASVLPGMWATGTPAGGTVDGTHKRSQAMSGYGATTATATATPSSASTPYDLAVKLALMDAKVAQLTSEGKHAEAAKIAGEADVLRASLNASTGTDWMRLLGTVTGAAQTAYRTHEGGTIVPQTPKEVAKAPEPKPAPKKGSPIGALLGVTVVIGLGVGLLKWVSR